LPARRLAIAVLACLLPLLVDAALGPRYGGELTLGVVRLPRSWEPRAPHDLAERLVLSLVHETLVSVGPLGLPAPGLARSFGGAASGREWTLTLGENLFFHDGKPLTSKEAVESLRRFLRSPSVAAARLAEGLEGGTRFRSGASEELPGIGTPDASRIVLRYREASALPLAALASPAAAVTTPGGVASGPFVPAAPVSARGLVLSAFGAHVRGRPYVDRVHLLATPEPGALDAEFQAGRIGIALGSSGGTSLGATLLLVLDPQRPPFDRLEARAAVASTIDGRDLVKHLILGGDSTPCLLSPGLLAPLPAPPPPPSEPRQVAATGALVMRVGRDVAPLVSQRIVAYLGQLGLRVEAEPAEAATLLGRNEAHLRLLLWSPEVAEAGLALEELQALGPPLPEAADALAAAARERDLDRRRPLLHRAESALRRQFVLIPLASAPIPFRSQRGVHGLRVDGGGRLLLEDAWLEP
jgi:ABC-type transport system substrate-binding protein